MSDDTSPELRAFLDVVGATRDEADRADEATLRALLAERGLPAYDVLFEIEARIGGLLVPDPGHEQAWGTFQLLRDQLPDARPGWAAHKHDGETLVWVGATSATVAYARHDGAILEVDFYSGHAVVVAGDIERRLLRDHIPYLENDAGLDEGKNFAGQHGQAIATALGGTLQAAYSDRFHRWWRGPGLSLIETQYPYDGQWVTSLRCRERALVDRAAAVVGSS